MRLSAAVPLSVIVAGCASFPQNPPEDWVEFQRGALGGSSAGYTLDYGMMNVSDRLVWALVEFDSPTGSRECEFIKRIEPRASVQFECPIELVPNRPYAIRLRAFRDDRLGSEVASRFDEFPGISVEEFRAFDEARADLFATGPNTVTAIDDGTKEVPSTFDPTWYRPLERPYKPIAYDHSGVLTVEGEAIAFMDGDHPLRIPLTSVTSVRLEELPLDFSNVWVVVRFVDDEERPGGAAFKDGAYLGHGTGTGLIYLAMRRATGK